MIQSVPSVTKKIVLGKPYYYLHQCKRVNGPPQDRLNALSGHPPSASSSA